MTQLSVDIRTLLLVSTIILLCRAALLAYAWAINRSYLPIRYWAIGSSALALGVLFFGLREIVPLSVSVMLGNAGVILGWMFTAAGTVTATQRKPPWHWGYGVALAALVCTFLLVSVWPNYQLRSIVVNLPGMLFDLYCIYACLRFSGGRWRTLTFRVLAAVLAVSIVSGLLKNLYVIRSGSASMFDSSPQVVQYYLLNVAFLVVCSVLYILLAEQRTQENLALEVAQRKSAQEEVKSLAYHDSLTQLPNRRLLAERLDLAISMSKRSALYGAVMLLDLDNFKPLNDAHGHGAGDLLLIEVAQRLLSNVREVDTVSRLGGDEFIVVLSSLQADLALSRQQAHAVAEKLRAKLAEPYVLVGTPKSK